jgi:hypothetical protein
MRTLAIVRFCVVRTSPSLTYRSTSFSILTRVMIGSPSLGV